MSEGRGGNMINMEELQTLRRDYERAVGGAFGAAENTYDTSVRYLRVPIHPGTEDHISVLNRISRQIPQLFYYIEYVTAERDYLRQVVASGGHLAGYQTNEGPNTNSEPAPAKAVGTGNSE